MVRATTTQSSNADPAGENSTGGYDTETEGGRSPGSKGGGAVRGGPDDEYHDTGDTETPTTKRVGKKGRGGEFRGVAGDSPCF